MESKNSHEWEKKLIGKILLDDNTEHSFSNDEVYMYS